MTSSQPESFSLTVVNMVATAQLGQTVNLRMLLNTHGFLYDTQIYRCAYLKDKRTRGKVSIFSTGRMISTGIKSVREAEHDLNYAAQRLTNLGLVRPTKIKVQLQNIVATANLGRPVDIEKLAIRIPHVIYDPEQFPGAIYHAEELAGSSILIFANGKLVVAGLKHLEDLDKAKRLVVELTDQMRGP